MRRIKIIATALIMFSLLSCGQSNNDEDVEVIEDSLQAIETTISADSMVGELNDLLENDSVIDVTDTIE